MRLTIIGAFLFGAFFPFSPACASGEALDHAAKHQIIQRLGQELTDRYIFPDRAAKAVGALAGAERFGAFDSVNDPEAFAKAVTAKLAETLHDKHLNLWYSSEVLPPQEDPASPSPAAMEIERKRMAFSNFGIVKAMRLRGNVGYLDIIGFPPGELMGPTLQSAMQFLSNTDSLIIDMRTNGGGDPSGVALLCSYLFPAGQKVHINDLYMRTAKTTSGKTEEYWTTTVPGVPYTGKTVYVLTSSHTFSGGEEFSYDMQTHKRATLVGETTGGGANPGDEIRLTAHFSAFIPNGRAINPITHTNWEGVGVKPDISTGAEQALQTAYLALLRARRDVEKDAALRQALSDLIDQASKSPGTILLK
jgi:hypothetical protein